jgi:hypothetical protein
MSISEQRLERIKSILEDETIAAEQDVIMTEPGCDHD